MSYSIISVYFSSFLCQAVSLSAYFPVVSPPPFSGRYCLPTVPIM